MASESPWTSERDDSESPVGVPIRETANVNEEAVVVLEWLRSLFARMIYMQTRLDESESLFHVLWVRFVVHR